MSTSQGTYVPIEQRTSEAIRVTYEICRAVGSARTGIENRYPKPNKTSLWINHTVYVLLYCAVELLLLLSKLELL